MSSEKLIKYYADIHASKPYGNTSVKNARFIRPDIHLLGPRSVIDFGCGQSLLLDQLKLPYPAELRRYDPAISSYSEKPRSMYDLLINVDVLEHIPETDLDPIIEECRSICRNAIFIVDTKAAKLILPNGENAHATIKSKDWWRLKIGRHFPHLVPIRVARSWRAAFRTWDHSPDQARLFRKMRLAEDVAHYRFKATTFLRRSFS